MVDVKTGDAESSIPARAEDVRPLGVGNAAPAPTLERYRGFGIDLEAASGERHHLLPVPAVYLVDRGGTIRFAHWNPDYKTRLSATELIEAAKKLPRE